MELFIKADNLLSRLSWLGKERDKESGLGDHGVRKYDNISGRFLSIDPLWEKYLSRTPYQYAGNNPVNAYDVDGRELILQGDINLSLNDLKHFVGENFSDRLSVDENNKLIVNTDNYKSGTSKDVDMLLLLVNANEVIGYETTNDIMKMDNNGMPIDPWPISNRSKTHFYKGMEQESYSNSLSPQEGFDGTVKINKRALFYYPNDKVEKRKNIIGHELLENYHRTVNKKNYFDAHKESNFNYWGGENESNAISIRQTP